MSTSFSENDVDLAQLPEDCRDIDSQAFVDAVQDLCYQPYEGHDGSFSFSYSEGQFEVSWIPLGDPGTEMLDIRWHLEDGRIEDAVSLRQRRAAAERCSRSSDELRCRLFASAEQ